MYDEAKMICERKRKFFKICEKKRKFFKMQGLGNGYKKWYNNVRIFDMFPFFVEALEELRSSESFVTLQQLHKTLSLLKTVISESMITEYFTGNGATERLACLHECVRRRRYVKKGPEGMIEALEDCICNIVFL